MTISILLLADIHGNWPALEAIAARYPPETFDHIVNCGDSLVYGPFPNETMRWLYAHDAVSILGNTDRKVKRLLKQKKMGHPRDPQKRIMYEATAASLDKAGRNYLFSLKKKSKLEVRDRTGKKQSIGIFHGSPDDPDEFLFDTTPRQRFSQLAGHCRHRIIVTGHSHTPYHYEIEGVHFINPGSAGRMFDGNPSASFAVLTIDHTIEISHFRLAYEVDKTCRELEKLELPPIYCEMFRVARKLN